MYLNSNAVSLKIWCIMRHFGELSHITMSSISCVKKRSWGKMWGFFYRDCKRRLDKQTCELLSAELSNTELVTTELLKNELVDT